MNRKRKTNRGLPRRVYIKHGAYYFVPTEPMRCPRSGKEQRWLYLASVEDGEPAMLTALGKLLGDNGLVEGSMPHSCAEFKKHKLSDYSKDVQVTYSAYLDVISKAFRDFHASEPTTKDCADFLRAKFKDIPTPKPNTAKKYAALMSKLFKFIIGELGLRQDNPIDQLDLSGYKTFRREVLPSHEQVQAIRKAGTIGKDGRVTHSGPMFECLVDIAYLCWQRAIDTRTMMESQIILNGGQLIGGSIRLKPSKTARSSGLALDILITPQIADVIERARAIKRRLGIVSGYLFPATAGRAAGKPYSKSGLCSMWDRARERAKIADGIQFKDLRALGATDAAKRKEDRKEIQRRLVHTSGKTTDIYIKEAVPEVSSLELSLPWAARKRENPPE